MDDKGTLNNSENNTHEEMAKDLKNITNVFREDVLKHLVVIIGSYGQKDLMKLIQTIIGLKKPKEKQAKYLALIAEDIKELPGETPRQKLHMILAMANFVVADDSVPSGEMIELEYCRHVGAITGVLRKKGIPSSWMASDIDIHSPDFKIVEYDKPDYKTISKKIDEIMEWAEERKQELAKEFKKRT